MKKITKKYRDEILKKEELLNRAKEKLKEEFVGIDKVIDEVIDSISSWFLFPDLQERPVVVNLWGLTGTGKTALVNRLTYYLKWEEKHFSFDLREKKDRNNDIENTLEDIYINGNGGQLILTFDEFQHAKTLNETGGELEETPNKIIWELLDSGKFQISPDYWSIYDVTTLLKKFKFFLRNSMKVVNGEVLSHKKFFIKEMDLTRDYYDNDDKFNNKLRLPFVPDTYLEGILTASRNKFSTIKEIQDVLDKLDGNETVEFLEGIIDIALSPKIIDCSKSLVFVIGNLDEAYQMSDNFDPDISADEFHELSLKISVTQIKSALRRRFRSEQIARLGNSHIIYPAFSTNTFYKIIDLELNKITSKVYESQNIKLEFDETIKNVIYKEGVYPTQGTRPIFTTIHNIISTKLGKIIVEMILKNLKADKIKFSFNNKKVIMNYYLGNQFVHKIEETQLLKLEKLRENKNDDMQSIVAVHECGHAICAIFLLKTIPEVIHSISVNDRKLGTTYTKFPWEYLSKKEILSRTAMMLGGYVAEKLIFGEENLTAGSESDIKKATFFVSDMIKNSGMDNSPAKFNEKDFRTNYTLYNPDVNNQVKNWIEKALRLAENILNDEETLLLQMANFLSDNRLMEKELIEEYCLKYGLNFNSETIIRNGDFLFYRNHLKEKVKNVSRNKFQLPISSSELCLNKIKKQE